MESSYLWHVSYMNGGRRCIVDSCSSLMHRKNHSGISHPPHLVTVVVTPRIGSIPALQLQQIAAVIKRFLQNPKISIFHDRETPTALAWDQDITISLNPLYSQSAVRSLLTSCSKEDFSKAFANFNRAEQQSLDDLFIQVITSLHKIIQDEFELLGTENQVGTALATVDKLLEERHLDHLSSERTYVTDAAHNLTTKKKYEIQCLIGMLERVEEQNHLLRFWVDLLKKERQDVPGTANIDKLQSGILRYWSSSNGI